MVGEDRLFEAMERDDTAKVERLLEEGANPNAREPLGSMPLHWAVSGGRLDVARLLLERGPALMCIRGRARLMS